MAAAASTCFWSKRFMSKGCWTSVTSFCGSIRYCSSVARSANSLPPNHTATLRPRKPHPALSKELGDVDEGRALLARGQEAREPVEPELSAAISHDPLRHDIEAAGTDRHVELLGTVEPLLLGGVVAGELRLGDPLELQRHLVGSHLVGGLPLTRIGRREDREQPQHDAHDHPA